MGSHLKAMELHVKPMLMHMLKLPCETPCNPCKPVDFMWSSCWLSQKPNSVLKLAFVSPLWNKFSAIDNSECQSISVTSSSTYTSRRQSLHCHLPTRWIKRPHRGSHSQVDPSEIKSKDTQNNTVTWNMLTGSQTQSPTLRGSSGALLTIGLWCSCPWCWSGFCCRT